jgi:hypothetical protein
VQDRLRRVVAEPADVLDDRLDVLLLLGVGVGVVEARLQTPSNSAAMPKSTQMALACPMCR